MQKENEHYKAVRHHLGSTNPPNYVATKQPTDTYDDRWYDPRPHLGGPGRLAVF